MTDKRFQDHIVTTDEEILVKLWTKFHEGVSSQELGEYAHTLGLYPPEYEDGVKDSITVSGFSDDGPRYLVWNIGLDRPDPTYLDQAREEAEDDDEFDDSEVWGELFPELRTNKPDRE